MAQTSDPITSDPIAADTAYDLVVIGGGAAGLSAALTAGRALRSVLVIDAGSPRNAPAAGAHNLLGHEGSAPRELLAKGRAVARAYGAQIVTGTVTDVTGEPASGFTVTLAPAPTPAPVPAPAGDRLAPAEAGTIAEAPLPSTVRARRIVLATGAVDSLPNVPGLAEHWGQDVIHCPYCHGYEVRGGRIGVLATDSMWLHRAKLIRQWSDDVTVLLHEQPAPSAEDRATLASRGVRIVEGRVREVLGARGHDGGGTGRLTGAAVDGLESPVPLDAILVNTRMRVDSALVDALGLAVEETIMGELVSVDMGRATHVPGVFAAGNVTNPGAMVAASMADGVMAAARANMDLVEEDFASTR